MQVDKRVSGIALLNLLYFLFYSIQRQWELIFLRNGFRPYWRCYFPNTQAVIYVVDSSDTDRIGVAKEEFHAILEVNFC